MPPDDTDDDVVVPLNPPVLVTVPDVEILEVGEDFGTLTGTFTFTAEDLAAAVDAMADPAIHSPILKLGHVDPRFDGEPAIGRLVNLRTTNEGQTLVADLAGVPLWLAQIMATAFPERSIEGRYEVKTQTGNTHKFVIDALSLLGVYHGAVQTLEDIRDLYGITPAAAPVAAGGEDHHVVLAARATLPTVPPLRVQAATSTEDVRRAYYDSLDAAQMWWWIREVQLDPQVLIVDDDEGGLLRVPYTISNDEITFGDPETVRIEYVAAAAATNPRAIVFASRSESRPQEAQVDPREQVRQRLGLPEDATDEQIFAALAAEASGGGGGTGDEGAGGDTTTTTTEPVSEATTTTTTTADETTPQPVAAGAGFTAPPGTVVVDATEWQRVVAGAQAGTQAQETIRQQQREAFMSSRTVRQRVAPSNAALRETVEREWDRDPAAAQRLVESLTVVVPTEEVGHSGEGEVSAAALDEAEARIFPELANVRSNGRA